MSYLIHQRGDRWSTPLRYIWDCQAQKIPAVIIQPKRRYASLVVNVQPAGLAFTDDGERALLACVRGHSLGVKSWSMSGGRLIWTCRRLPVGHADACAKEIVSHLNAWTMPAPAACF